ncbi:MAG TPA: sugar phosphate isomerase/epimerase family protein [Cyclobacteriaceae bacterium]|nr:sugar phosphate isomerase/epimerase family protein [Cyclobacteriaceae bacterium]
MKENQRREFLKKSIALTAGMGIFSAFAGYKSFGKPEKDMFFKISLAEWSLNKSLFAKKLDNLDFPAKAKNEYGIDAVEFVNQFFRDKAKDTAYLNELKTRCDDLGVSCVLIMIDGEGSLAVPEETERAKAVENHYKWIDAAKYLGCHAVRVNARGKGSNEEMQKAMIASLTTLSEYGSKEGIEVVVENHGGPSSDGKWLSGIMKAVNSPYCGTLPDLGNFCIQGRFENGKMNCLNEYDKYLGVEELMPYAKGVSAKAYDFDAEGNETTIDYKKMLQIVKNAGFKGRIGIEYEGRLPEDEGIMATKRLLERLGEELS